MGGCIPRSLVHWLNPLLHLDLYHLVQVELMSGLGKLAEEYNVPIQSSLVRKSR